MRVGDLARALQRAIDDGFDPNCRVAFDTEARAYTVHYVDVDTVLFEPDICGEPLAILYSEVTNRMRCS